MERPLFALAGRGYAAKAMQCETIPDSWRAALEPALTGGDVEALCSRLDEEEAAGKTIYPPRTSRFRAFAMTPPDAVKVVILGQDPYHGPGQAMGLAFSVPRGVKVPPSLANIYKELRADCDFAIPDHGDLTQWAKEGVLLLNTTLTVEAHRPGSHARRGWDRVTRAAIEAVAARPEPKVFLLWGNHAQGIAAQIPALAAPRNHVIASVHPSPLSARRGFFGSRPFSRANAFLESHGRGAIDWRVDH